VDPGALAGGIIGAFLGGIILALMAAFLFNRRRNKNSNRRDPGQRSIESAHRTPKKPSRERHEISSAWERLIPQPVDDETMGTATKSLLDQVALHVDNFYVRKTLQIPLSKLESFAKMDTGLLSGPIEELMMDADTQLPVIKHCISFLLTAKMMPGVDASDKLLPTHLALLPLKLAPDSSDEKEMLGKIHQSSYSPNNDADVGGRRTASIFSLEIFDILSVAGTCERFARCESPTASHQINC
jgi:hypothetical protein